MAQKVQKDRRMSKYIPLHIIEFLEFSLKNNVLVQSSADTNTLAVLSSYNPSRLGEMCTILGVLMTFGGALRTNLEIFGVLYATFSRIFRNIAGAIAPLAPPVPPALPSAIGIYSEILTQSYRVCIFSVNGIHFFSSI